MVEQFKGNKELFQGKIVMDLGCGHGLLGILALKFGAKMVIFQDFNSEVLQTLTFFNLLINNVKDIQNRVVFTSGD